ncbi:flavin-containing monooxygenase [Aspergillus candidus]|uniref:FAD/NAD(P)-binding domain-containing protein n=1 Tax=Aspergillus candidus TaxID=41067 RepID=A0A2I2FJW2_ASPCN|nr:FAD/NAD(P)-binding domain-containing protein [Aspergillus candidus]PLB40928.1 FAD/NAD(P)-binding domain-containing protein [Aspergillus candidus]
MAQTRLSQIASQLSPGGGQGNRSPDGDEPSYTVCERPLGAPRPIRIVCIGAGASGLNLIRSARQGLTDFEIVVYEKNTKIGGTWFENRYPGCKCDITSHNYQFSWHPNPGWTSFFSPAQEIEEYLCTVCKEERMADAIHTDHEVVSAEWEESSGVWKVRVRDTTGKAGEFEDHCQFLIDARGILNHWKWPTIQGLHDFQGTLVHSANWPRELDYTGKRVAVIGNGSSGIQIVPAMQPTVDHLVHFVRSPTWIAPPRVDTLRMSNAAKILDQIELDANEKFTPRQIEKFRSDPAFYKRFVKSVEEEVNGNFPITLKDSDTAAFATASLRMYMADALGDDERLCKALIPEFPVGCRRLTPGTGYLESLRAPNVRLVTDGISGVVPQGIQTTGGEIIELDIIVCATGFDVSFCPRFPIVGRQGNLQDIWSTCRPRAYMSCAVPGLPNYFCFLGPNAPIGHGSVFTVTEHVANYIVNAIRKCQTQGIKALAPTHAAMEDFYQHIDIFMPRTAWAGGCRSWFKNGAMDGPVTALHPGSRIHFFHMLEQFRGEDWEYVYDNPYGNRFSYLGNGFSTKEQDGSDSTWYLNH